MTEKKEVLETRQICGIVMPISSIDGCNENHWNDVLEIINDCIEEAGFDANLVSNADEVGVIQKRIIQNLYENPIVVCDVSGKNPNVMFELGLRLAFDKPTIIIKDDKTSYSFDTSPIEHLEYPRDLRFNRIEDFKTKLIDKIIKTDKKFKEDDNYSTFLKHFGEFKVAKLDKKEVSQQEYILDEMKSLRRLILQQNNRRSTIQREISEVEEDDTILDVCCGRNNSEEKLKKIIPKVVELPGVFSAIILNKGNNHCHIKLIVSPSADRQMLKDEVRRLTRRPIKSTMGK